jgi:two-component system response regulator PilR (NtrC family)/two-component system response regulator HydG
VSARILVVEDEEVLRTNLVELLARAGHDVEGVGSAEAGLARVLEAEFSIVLTDIRLPGMDGISLLKRIVAERPETLVLVTTAYASVESAVEALRHGAYDYLLKPVTFEDLLQKVQNLVAFGALKQEVVRLRRDLHARLGFEGLMGKSPQMQAVFELIDKVAPTHSTVLITGESGTGKELVARAVHARSALADKEFLAVNMAAIPAEVVEAQLFGHEKGAFTGADRRREGLLRSVRAGTVFLDEIGDLPMPTQVKLLRAIESHEVMPVGADRPEKVDFRLIAATNKDLETAVKDGRFRQDLFYRLNVVRVRLPSLRERRDDVPELVSHFMALHARALGKAPRAVSNEAMKLLLAYPWPGNVRELSNVLERAAILAAGAQVEPGDLPAEFHAASAAPTELRAAVEQFEAKHIAWVLRLSGGNREQAARTLGIDPATLYRRLSKYQVE